jgi:lycopene beta-cyclase
MKLEHYQITEVENGIIPMTNLSFPKHEDKITYIGTAGGQTKASTGYTFHYIQKHSDALVTKLRETGEVAVASTPKRFRFYDSVLLRVLHERKLPGAEVFFQLFMKNPASRVFRFLDNESSLLDELQIMNSTPKSIFVPAALAEMK